MRIIILSLLFCAVVLAQGIVYNPFTKRFDKVGAPGPPGPPGGTGILDESAPLPAEPNINFVGAGVTCIDNPGLSATECIIPTPPAAVQTIFDEAVSLTQRPTLKFIGAGVTCIDNAGTDSTDCTISGGGGGGGLSSLTTQAGVSNAGTLTDPILGFHWQHTGTITTSPYTVLSTDNGTVKRFAGSVQIDVSLPHFNVPFHFLAFNDGTQPVVLTPTTGDINGDPTLILQPQEGALLSEGGAVGANSAFYRGLTVTGRVASGSGVPLSNRCDTANEVGKVYVRTDAAAVNASLYICSNTGASVYAWEGPFSVSGGGGGGGATQFSELNDFKCTATSSTLLTVTPGSYAVGNYPFPSTVGGTITFSGGSGLAVVYVDEQGQLVTEAATTVTQSGLTGQMTFTTATSPAIPDTAVPVCNLTVTAGTYAITSTGHAARLRNSVNKAGNGLLKTVTNGRATFSVDPAVVCLSTGNCPSSGGGATKGTGAPTSGSCDSSGEVGDSYVDTNPGGDEWRCMKLGATAYVWVPKASPGAFGTLRIRDDFMGGGGPGTSGNLSDLNIQNVSTAAGTIAFVAGEANHYGMRRFTSSTTLDANGGFGYTAGTNVTGNIGTVTVPWVFRAIFRTDPTAVTNAFYCMGWCGSGGNYSNTHHVGLIRDSAAGHGTWHFRAINASVSTGTDTDTTVSIAAATWYDFAMWSITAGTVCYSLNQGAETCHSANIPATASGLAVLVGTRSGGTAYALDADMIEYTQYLGGR